MYVEQPSFISPFSMASVGFALIAIGAVLMIEAGRASVRGASPARIERDGSAAAWSILIGIGLLVVAGFWAVLS